MLRDDTISAEKVRAEAAALIPEIVASRDEKLRELQRAHEADKASYSFRCTRHGDFLAVFMSRGPKPSKTYSVYGAGRPNQLAAVINLGASRVMTIRLGAEPNMEGTVTFQATHSTTGYGARAVYSSARMTENAMIVADPGPQDQQSMMMYGHQLDPLAGLHVPECPQGATDDTIYFLGPGITVHAPAGLGQSVMDAILAEVGRV